MDVFEGCFDDRPRILKVSSFVVGAFWCVSLVEVFILIVAEIVTMNHFLPDGANNILISFGWPTFVVNFVLGICLLTFNVFWTLIWLSCWSAGNLWRSRGDPSQTRRRIWLALVSVSALGMAAFLVTFSTTVVASVLAGS